MNKFNMDKDTIKIKCFNDFIVEKYNLELIDGTYYRDGVAINEMVYVRQDFILYLRFQLSTIAAHYVLLRYASKHNEYEQLVGHWRGELESKIVDVREMDTKPKSNNRPMVKRALGQEWKNSDFKDNPWLIVKRITPKLKEEGVDASSMEIMEYVKMFIDDMPTIMELMSNCNDMPIEPFLNKICPTKK